NGHPLPPRSTLFPYTTLFRSLDEPAVYEEIQRADTVGVFQIESRAQMQSLLQTRPENLDDLTVQVALVRPGPIQGDLDGQIVERSEEHTSELQSRSDLVCRLL